MIVRISGIGQYELNDQAVRQLDQLDTALTNAMNEGDAEEFSRQLSQIVQLVQSQGGQIADDRVVPSDVIVPPEDITLEEARQYMTDEGLMQPLPA